jgi:hypothetical protein
MAVTAYPTILIDSATGVDAPSASGAGPTTAITGTNAATDGGGTQVTLDGSPDLSGVASDGSHVIYLHDTTSGNRRFAAINAVDDTAKTVDVEQAFAGMGSGLSWAIGGILDTLSHTNTAVLYNNNSAAGDAMGEWKIQLADGHTETFSSSIRFYRSLSGENITVQGESGFTTRPKLICDTAVSDSVIRGNGFGYELKGIEVETTHSTGDTTAAVERWYKTENVLIHNNCTGTGETWYGFYLYSHLYRSSATSNSKRWEFYTCYPALATATTRHCYIGKSGRGIYINQSNQTVENCIFNGENDTITGILIANNANKLRLINNVVDDCTTGIDFSSTNAHSDSELIMTSITNCDAGINFHTSATDVEDLLYDGFVMRYCNMGGNTRDLQQSSGDFDGDEPSRVDAFLTTVSDPYVDRDGNDFQISDSSLLDIQIQFLSVGNISYHDVGAVQTSDLGLLASKTAAYYKMDEASGDALDAIGGKDLGESGTLGTDTGQISTARTQVGSTPTYFTIADQATFQLDTSPTISFWFYQTQGTTGLGGRQFMKKGTDWKFNVSGSNIRWEVTDGASTLHTVNVTTTTATHNTWNFIVVGVDFSDNKLFYSLNGGTITKGGTTLVSGVTNSSSAFTTNGTSFNGGFNSRIDEVGFYNTKLSQADINTLYNSGTGLTYPFTESSGGGSSGPVRHKRLAIIC